MNFDLNTPLVVDDEAHSTPFNFKWSSPDEAYLRRLRDEYNLDAIVTHAADDYEKVKAIRKWARDLWSHDGWNEPSQNDPLTILREAAEGKNFRCVEYAICTSGALTALGIPARVMSLKTQDVETRETGASHVVLEAYLTSLDKWVFVDTQWDVTPFLHEQPLSAVELQHAITREPERLSLDTSSGTEQAEYSEWIAPYLFYFDVPFDNRIRAENALWRLEGLNHLMLVPLGAPEPTTFQRKWSLEGMKYTHSLSAFYARPLIEPRR